MCKYIFSEKISFDKEYIVLREPLTSEIDGMSDDYKNNISILKKIFKNVLLSMVELLLKLFTELKMVKD